MEHILTGTQLSEELLWRDRHEVTNLEARPGLALGLLTFTQHLSSST